MNITKVSSNRVDVEFSGKIDSDPGNGAWSLIVSSRRTTNAYFGSYSCGAVEPAENI